MKLMTVTADGSVRVYSGLMDIMDDNELLFRHWSCSRANHDSRDAIKAVYKRKRLWTQWLNQIKWRPLQTVN
jgi:hypothetical protein